MSRLAGFHELRYEDRQDDEYFERVNHIANLPSTERSALQRDWTVALEGGPRDGQMRRLNLTNWGGAQTQYEYHAFKVGDGARLSVDHYIATGYSPYQRVMFARYAGTQDCGAPGRRRPVKSAADLKRYMIEDGDL